MKRTRKCSKCGEKIFKKGCLCSDCALKSKKQIPEPDMLGSFDTVQEICNGNINTRLRDGFRLLQEE